MSTIKHFEQLDVWRKARDLANEIYAISSDGRFVKDYVLRDQIRRAAVSVISNIAEGFERGGIQEFLQFLSVAKGSIGEVRAQLYIALDQGYVQRPAFDHLQELANAVGGKLGGLIAYLKTSGFRGSKYRTGEPGTRDPKPETRNAKRGTPQGGFSLPTAIFLVVVLWLLGAFIVSITGTQQIGFALDVQGTRAYQAARSGVEWAAYHALDPNNTLPGNTLPSCPTSPTTLPALGGTLASFTVTVTCAETTTTESNRDVRTYLIISTAVSGTPGTATYVERQLQAVLSKCKDQTAPGPRFACG